MSLVSLLSSKKFVSGQEIAKNLNISRSAVHKRIKKLRFYGYKIIGQRNLGYSLISKPDILFHEEINALIPSNSIFYNSIRYYKDIDSTQKLAKDLAIKGAKEGTVVISEIQRQGYGRFSRRWISNDGGLWFSIILRPNILPENVSQLTLVLSLSICRVLNNLYNLVPLIKWPNDIILNNKKVAGILTELSAEIGMTRWVVVGVGLNVNNRICQELRDIAISIFEVLNTKIDRIKLISEILKEFEELYKEFLINGFKPFVEEYDKINLLKDETVRVITLEDQFEAKVLNIDEHGFLICKDQNGDMVRIIAGEVQRLSYK